MASRCSKHSRTNCTDSYCKRKASESRSSSSGYDSATDSTSMIMNIIMTAANDSSSSCDTSSSYSDPGSGC